MSLNRLPIRVRLTALFTLTIAAVLVLSGLFFYRRLDASLTHTIDEGLDVRADDLADRLRSGAAPDELLSRQPGHEGFTEAVAQILDLQGDVVSSTGPADPMLTPEQLGRVVDEAVLAERNGLATVPGSWRTFGLTASAGGRRYVVVTAAPLANRDHTLDVVRQQLLVGGILVLAAATLAAYALARAALHPVEVMRRRASVISELGGATLPVPPADDEIARLGHSLNDMLRRLDAANQRERQFVADASHELRTPLALLRTELDLALRRPRTRDQLREAIQSAAEETERLTRLANDLLLLARADDGALPLEPEPLQVGELLHTVSTRFAHRADGRHIIIEVADDLTIQADRLRLEQALGNLIDNALRHGRGDVTVLATPTDSGTVLRISDQGPGMPPQLIDNAFDRFTTGPDDRTGSGLGLAIVAAIVRAHGGTATAHNRPSRGAEITLTLPATSRPPQRSRDGTRGSDPS